MSASNPTTTFPQDLTAEDRAGLERFLAVFETQDAEGRYTFPDHDVRQLLPGLALLAGWSPAAAAAGGANLASLMAEFRELVELPADAPLAAWEQAASQYYQDYPPNPALLAKLQQHLQAE